MARKLRIQDAGAYVHPESKKQLEKATAESMGVELTGKGFDDYDLRKFTYGTITGLWQRTRTAIEIVLITNHKPGNGDFPRFMRALKDMAERSDRSIVFVEVMNESTGSRF